MVKDPYVRYIKSPPDNISPPYIKGEMSGNVRLVSVLRARQVSAPLARWSFAAAGPLLVVPALRTGMLRNEMKKSYGAKIQPTPMPSR